jgi:uncharacterized membrane protein HdeD (DUF308 family)
MLTYLAKNWWALALRGVLGVFFGLAALMWPQITLVVLVLLFGAYALVDGVFNLMTVVMGQNRPREWWAVLLEALVGIGVGIVTFAWPEITAVALLFLIAAWAIITGVFEIVASIRLRDEIKGEWLLALAGVLSLAFGIVLLVNPGAGAIALVGLIGAYAIVFGALLVVLGLRLRSWYQSTLPS